VSAKKKYRITIWQKGNVNLEHGEYWVRHDQLELTRAQAVLLEHIGYGVGYRGTWCGNKMRPVNGRMVSVETLE